MKLSHWSIPFAVLASALATPVFALPPEPDYSCYLINPCGEAINLTQMCATRAGRVKNLPHNQAGNSQVSRTPRYGKVPQVSMQVFLSNGVWITNGKIQNQTNRAIGGVLVTLEIRDGSGSVQTQTASLDQTALNPGELGSFQAGISYASVRQTEGQPLVVPAVRVASVQWVNPDGTAGSYP